MKTLIWALTFASLLTLPKTGLTGNWDENGDDNPVGLQEHLQERESWKYQTDRIGHGGKYGGRGSHSGGFTTRRRYSNRQRPADYETPEQFRKRMLKQNVADCLDYVNEIDGWETYTDSGDDRITAKNIDRCRKHFNAYGSVYKGDDGKYRMEGASGTKVKTEKEKYDEMEGSRRAQKSARTLELESIERGEQSFREHKVAKDEDRINKGGDWKTQRLRDIANGKRKFTQEELKGGKAKSHSEISQEAEANVKKLRAAYSQYLKQQQAKRQAKLARAKALAPAQSKQDQQIIKAKKSAKSGKKKENKNQPFYLDDDGNFKDKNKHGLTLLGRQPANNGSARSRSRSRNRGKGGGGGAKQKGQFNPDGSVRFHGHRKERGFSIHQSDFSNPRINY